MGSILLLLTTDMRREQYFKAILANCTMSHLTAAMFSKQACVQLTYIPYRGTAPALTDRLGAHVDVFFDNISSVLPQHTVGVAKNLVITGVERSSLLPQMRTLSKATLPGFEASTWFGIIAAPGTPPAIADKLHAAIAVIIPIQDMQQQLSERSTVSAADSPAEMRNFMVSVRKPWKAVNNSTNVKVD